MNNPPMPVSARPTTESPITDPPAKATCRAWLRPLRAALAVRMLAPVAVFIPKKPASPEQNAPRTNDNAISPLVPCAAPTM
jgi:hypothetical protein